MLGMLEVLVAVVAADVFGQRHAHRHLLEIRAMVLALAVLANLLSAFPFEVSKKTRSIAPATD